MIDAFNRPESAIQASAALCGGGALVSSLEWWALRREFTPSGSFDWKLTGSRRFLLRHPRVGQGLALLFEPPGVLVLIAARALAALLLIVAAVTGTGLPVPFAVLALTSVLIHYRQPYGLDGSDQMTLIIALGLAVGLALGVESLAVAFVAAQAVLSYFIAGVAKFGGRAWREGTAVPAILSTRSFGVPPLGARLSEQRWIGRGLTWSTMSFESLFPLALLAPGQLLVAFLVAGALLHLSSAVTMGLNVFPLAFIASYPCLIWAAHHL
jgi:Vitamin K-dependent gamma-carboxylase